MDRRVLLPDAPGIGLAWAAARAVCAARWAAATSRRWWTSPTPCHVSAHAARGSNLNHDSTNINSNHDAYVQRPLRAIAMQPAIRRGALCFVSGWICNYNTCTCDFICITTAPRSSTC